MEINAQVRTSLPLGRGDSSCDIVIVRGVGAASNKLLYLVATNNPPALEFYHSPERAFAEADMPARVIASAIRWANKEYKMLHMLSSSRMTDVDQSGISALRNLMAIIVSERGMHPPAVWKAEPANVHRAHIERIEDTSRRNRGGAECKGRIFRLVAEGDMPAPRPIDQRDDLSPYHCAVVALETDFEEGGPLNVPHPVPRADGSSVNSTVMLLGRAFSNCTGSVHTAKEYSPEPGFPDTTPPWLREYDHCECRIMYHPPTTVRLALGFNYTLSPTPGDRLCLGLSGVRMIDRTEKRLMICTEVSWFTVPTACGCGIRDLVHFERPHIPLLLSPRYGLEYVFDDHPEGVKLAIDGVPSGVIRTTSRHQYGGVLWVDWTES